MGSLGRGGYHGRLKRQVMSVNEPVILTRVKALTIRARAALALAVAEMVMPELAEDPEGSRVAEEALRLSWRWVGGEPVKGDEIDNYVGNSTGKNLTTYALRYHKKPMCDAM